jgi:diguanylate cyclase (GGDEF)-like protein
VDPSVQYDGGDGGLFSLQEVQRLMRIEFERSKRYHYPLACFLIAVDRLERLQDLHGVEIKRAVHQALTELLRAEIRSSDLLACLLNERLLVMLPHATREGADALAQRILSGARRLAFESQGRSVRISLSIGGAHNQHVQEPQYETLLSVAEGGLDVAVASGGDRYVHSELYEHFEKKHQRDERRRRTDTPGTPGTGAVEPEPPEPQPGRQIFALGSSPARPAPLPARTPAPEPEARPALSPAERDEALAAMDREHRQEVENLERRITKLTAMLERTESDLRRMAEMKVGDDGVASIYKNVQGLSQEESALELKRDLMQKIFEANMELKQAIARGTP